MEKSTPKPGVHLSQAMRILIKALVLFVIIDLSFVILDPAPALGKLSAYNWLFPGRQRLPYGDHPNRAYNLSLYNLPAMLASHEISAGQRPTTEYRVLLIGDSSTWGFLLKSTETISSQMNRIQARLPDGRQVKVYNLGYPVMSATKDLLLLSQALRYKPDLVIWLITLESFPDDKQLFPPFLQNNPELVNQLITTYRLQFDRASLPKPPTFWQRTLIGQRRALADLVRLQFYGILWSATGVDQDIPASYTPRQSDLSDDLSFHDLSGPSLQASDLALDVIAAAHRAAGRIPVLLVNEPIFISQGKNSAIRYNYYYPRWAYDDYRSIMTAESQAQGWRYLDLWDYIPADEFTNSAVHLSPAGAAFLAERLLQAIQDMPY